MILGTISDSQRRVSFKDIKEIMSQFPQVREYINTKNYQQLYELIDSYAMNTSGSLPMNNLCADMLLLLADISTKDANLFSDCVIHNEPFVSLWTYLHIDKINYTKCEHFSVNMIECEIDVVEIKIPEGASKISQLDTTHHNYWLSYCTINELQIINYSKIINTKTLKSRILKMFEKYNIDVTVNEVKIINK